MKIRKVISKFIFLLLILTLSLAIFSHFSMAADPSPDDSQADDFVTVDSQTDVSVTVEKASNKSFIGLFFKEKYDLWKLGSENLKTGKGRNAVSELLKYLSLFLVIILVYSAFAYAKFPESSILQIVLAIVVGFLATFLITSQELLTFMQSYTALGITFSVFLPIMILGFFTLVVASKGAPIGIFVQKIMWLIYSVYLFLKTGILFIAKQYYVPGEQVVLPSYLGFLKEPIKTVPSYDSAMLVLLVIVSIAVFVIMVLGNKSVDAWLMKERREASILARKNKVAKSKAWEDINAEAMDNQE